MVSQVAPSPTALTHSNPHSQSLTPRTASSVTSRSSRRHRHGRSLAGGTSYVPQNEFPIFSQTGDVEIIVKAGDQTNRYLLHRIYLAQCSGFFEASTSAEWSKAVVVAGDTGASGGANGGELARIGEESGSESSKGRLRSSRDGGSGSGSNGNNGSSRKRWRYELDFGTNDDDIPMLVQKDPPDSTSIFSNTDARPPPPVRNKPPASNTSFFRSVANLSLAPTSQTHVYASSSSSHVTTATSTCTPEDLDLLNDYDNLFRIFYNYAPSLDSIDIATAYLQCKSLLQLADQYDCLPVVGPRIDHHLLTFQSRLWKQIAKYPSSYLKIGYLAQSKSIFQEALIHVVGAWPVGERHIRAALPRQVVEVIEDKVADLEDAVARVEGRLFRLGLLTARGERVGPLNGMMDWLVVSLFRQWVVDHTSPIPVPLPRTPQGRDGGGHSHGHGRSHHSSRSHPPPLQQQTPQQNLTSQTSAHLPLPSTSTPPNLGLTYRLLGGPPAGYLTHDDCKRFLKLTPEFYSREGLRKFERRLDELKAAAREVVRPLMGCALEGSGAGEGVGYLVCTRVGEGDWPWEV